MLVPCSRHGLLAYVYSGVSDRMNAFVAGNGSYIVRPCGHDLHGPTDSKTLQSHSEGNKHFGLSVQPQFTGASTQ